VAWSTNIAWSHDADEVFGPHNVREFRSVSAAHPTYVPRGENRGSERVGRCLSAANPCSGTDAAGVTLVGIRSVLIYGRIFRLLIRDGRQLTAREVAGRKSV
jgi:hypothetical protein